jgi:hypothetical protein
MWGVAQPEGALKGGTVLLMFLGAVDDRPTADDDDDQRPGTEDDEMNAVSPPSKGMVQASWRRALIQAGTNCSKCWGGSTGTGLYSC